MTRFRALVIGGALLLGFTFNGCFDGGGDDCPKSAAPAGTVVLCEI